MKSNGAEPPTAVGVEPSRNDGRPPESGADPVAGASPTEVVIERPDLQSRRQRLLYSAATAVAWAVWMYLWLPAVTLLAWVFGIRRFMHEIAVPDAETMLSSTLLYLGVIGVLGGGLLLWSRYNLRRFGGTSRRRSAPRVSDEEIRRHFSLSRGMLADVRRSRRLVVHHDPSGMVVDTEPAEERGLVEL